MRYTDIHRGFLICTGEMCSTYGHGNQGQDWQDGVICLLQVQAAADPASQGPAALDGAGTQTLAAAREDSLAKAEPASSAAAASAAMPEGPLSRYRLPAAFPDGQVQAANLDEPMPQAEPAVAHEVTTGNVPTNQAVHQQCPGEPAAAAVPAEQPQPDMAKACMAAPQVQDQPQVSKDLPEATAAVASGTVALADQATSLPTTAAAQAAAEPLTARPKDKQSAGQSEISPVQQQLDEAKQSPAAATHPQRNMNEDVGTDGPAEKPPAHCQALETGHLSAAKPPLDASQGVVGDAEPEGPQVQHQAHDGKLLPAEAVAAAAVPAENEHPLINTAHLLAATASAVPMQSSNFDPVPGTGQLLPVHHDLTVENPLPNCLVSQAAGPEQNAACSSAFPAEVLCSEGYKESCDLAEIIFQKWQGSMLSSSYRVHEGDANRFMTIVCQLRLQNLAVMMLDKLKVRVALLHRRRAPQPTKSRELCLSFHRLALFLTACIRHVVWYKTWQMTYELFGSSPT